MSFQHKHWGDQSLKTGAVILLAAALVLGCGHSGTTSSDRGASGGSANSGSGGSQGGKPGGASGGSGGGSGNQLTEPVDSTTGSAEGPAAAASDDGTPRAVTHTSSALPGTPQATLKGKQQDKKLDSPESPMPAPTAPKANQQGPSQ